MIFNDHIHLFLKHFFSSYPREIAVPTRIKVNDIKGFFQVIEQNHFKNSIFTNLYQITNQKVLIDKLWIDFDGANQYLLTKEVKKTIERFLSLGIKRKNILIVFTGKKGYHLYVKMKPIKLDIETTRAMLHYILSYVTLDLKTPDRPIFSDVRRITRVAGIQRPEKSICFVLDNENFDTFPSINEYLDFYKYNYSYMISKGNKQMKKLKSSMFSIKELHKKIKEENFEIDELVTFREEDKISYLDPIEKKERSKKIKGKAYTEFLKKILPDDLFYSINSPNPIHRDRIRFAKKLLDMDFDVPFVIEIISTLRWIDYDPTITEKNVRYIKRKYVKKL